MNYRNDGTGDIIVFVLPNENERRRKEKLGH